MAKTVKKAKPAAKPASKVPAKPLKKQAKAPAPAKVVKAKATEPAKAKPAPVKKEIKAAPVPKTMTSGAKKPGAEKAKSGKADAKAKKAKRDEDLDDDLMVSDEDMSAEEIPDLSEFDEEEEAVPEVEIEDDSAVLAAPTGPSNNDSEAVLTDAEGRPYCKVKDCDQIAAVETYCRYHYLLLWKKIQVRRKILIDGKLERYVEELTSRYPDKFLEMIKRDLRSDKDFQAAIAELEIDESGLDNEFEDEAQVIDEVRGFGSESSISDDEDAF